MKTSYFVLYLLCAVAGFGNIYIPKAKLVGESVLVRLAKDKAEVDAVFEFNGWRTSDPKIVYFPIFGTKGSDPIGVLTFAALEISINGKSIGVATPCEAPRKSGAEIDGRDIFWFSANVDTLFAISNDSAQENDGPLVVHVHYFQPLIGSQFYYLPVITADPVASERDWRFQLIARSSIHVIELTSKVHNAEKIGESVIVYLRDREIVGLK